MAIDPRHIEIEHWSALTGAILARYGYVPTSTTEEDWRSWAQRACHLPQLSALNIPDPYLYEDWRTWAFRLNEALLALGVV